jgi:hypothetical protein
VVPGSSARRQWLVAAAWAGLAVAGTAFAQFVAPAPEDPVATPPGNAAGNPATASATDAYTSFRTEFDAGRYAEAVPHAERVLELTAAQATTPTAEEVQVALMNLGMVQNLSDDYVGAESTYLQVIKLIESSGRPLHDRLARAYAGLASAYHDGNRHDLAVKSFDQAIALKRRHEGLLTAQQVPLIEKYIDSLTELGRYPEPRPWKRSGAGTRASGRTTSRGARYGRRSRSWKPPKGRTRSSSWGHCWRSPPAIAGNCSIRRRSRWRPRTSNAKPCFMIRVRCWCRSRSRPRRWRAKANGPCYERRKSSTRPRRHRPWRC